MSGEQLMLQRFFQGDTGWAQAVYLASMFAILIWKREAVFNWGLFRTSYLLYGASLVAPPIIAPIIQLLVSGRGANPMNADSQVFTFIVANATGPFLLAGAIVCGLGSMIGRPTFAAPTAVPLKHPLD